MALVDRLSKLDAPDREVDAEIYIRFNIPAERAGRIDYSNGMVGWWPKDGPYVSAVTVPAYTASLDVTIDLTDRELPGVDATIRTRHNVAWLDGFRGRVCEGATPAIALLIALLRAKEASK
jgi:hypothetical protein